MQDSENYKEIISRSEELKEQAEKIKNEQNIIKHSKLPFKTYLTGLIQGKIIDLDIDNNKIKIDIILENNEKITIYVEDTKKYEEKNELVRLLNYKNIQNYEIDDLLGRKITLVSETPIYTRKISADELTWHVYIPSRLDMVSKIYHKFNILNRLIGNQYIFSYEKQKQDKEEKIINVFSYMFVFTFINIIISLIITPFYSDDITLFINSILITTTIFIFVPTIIRLILSMNKKYKAYKEKDTLQN